MKDNRATLNFSRFYKCSLRAKEYESKCHKTYDEVKSRTSKLRAKLVLDDKTSLEDVVPDSFQVV